MELIKDTPWWVFVLLAYLIFIGIKALKSQTVSFKKLLILPALFAIWNISWLFTHSEGKYSYFALWFIGIVLGGVIGWQFVRTWKVKADHKTKTITLPGSPTTLIFILLVFVIRYIFGYLEAVNPNPSAEFLEINAGVSGILTGIFIGRTVELYRKYSRARS